MSSRIFQSIIIQMKDATDRCIGVVDDQGVVAACSELSMIGTKLDDFHGGFGGSGACLGFGIFLHIDAAHT